MKNRRKKGFTFVETLVALMIVSMLSLVVMTGIRTAWNAHDNALFASESEILADTINTSLGDLFHYASYDKTEDGTVRFSSQEYGVLRGTMVVDDKGRLYVMTTESETGSKLQLVNDGAYTNITIEEFKLDYDSTNAVFTGSYTLMGSRDQSKEFTFTFAPVNPSNILSDNS